MIVPKPSATLGYPKEVIHGLNGNHLTITKFGSKEDPNFITVTTELRKVIAEIDKEAEAMKRETNALYNPK
jgi:hypothetical protein